MADSANEMRADPNRLRKLITKKRFEDFESTWMEAIGSPNPDVDGLVGVLETLVKRDQAQLADSMFWFLLSRVVELGGPADGVDLIRKASGFLMGGETLRDEVASLCRQAFTSVDGIETMTRMTVLNAAVPFPVATARLSKLLALKPESCAHDSQMDIVVQIVALNEADEVVEARTVDGQTRRYDRLGIDKLEPIPDDDLRSRMVREREHLEQIAWEHPSQLARIILGTYGPRMDFKPFKAQVAELLGSKQWGKWWKTARAACNRDPMLEMGEGTQPWVFLRKEPVAYEAELKWEFDQADSAEARLGVALGYLHECAQHEHEPQAEFCTYLAGRLAGKTDRLRETEPAMALGAEAVLARLSAQVADIPEPSDEVLRSLVDGRADLAGLMRSMASDDLALCVLDWARQAGGEAWPTLWSSMLPGCSASVAAAVADGLLEGKHSEALVAAVGEILARPERYPLALTWLWKVACAGDLPRVAPAVSRFDVAVNLLSAANRLSLGADISKSDAQVISQLRAAISAKNFQGLKAALQETGDDGAVRAFRAAERSFALGDHVRVQTMNLITQTHPAAFLETVQPWEDESTLYTTAAALERQQKEYEELVNVKVPANAKAIGAAASLGDLSENAEFTAALEERDRLAERAGRMQADLEMARVITPTMTQSDMVTVGSTVVARSLETGQEELMTFLGPWDSDPDRGVYSYRAALAQAFMGRKAGDHTELTAAGNTRSWEIVEVRPADLG